MSAPEFEVDLNHSREKAHKLSLSNKRKLRLKSPAEKRMDSITFWWSRFEDRYMTDKSYQMKIDFWLFMSCSLVLGIMLGVLIAMIYGVVTYPY